MSLLATIVASGKGVLDDEAAPGYFPGDDLFAVGRPRGLPIGNLTSQFFANVLLDQTDHFVRETLRVAGYVRYCDDLVLFGDDKASLWQATPAAGECGWSPAPAAAPGQDARTSVRVGSEVPGPRAAARRTAAAAGRGEAVEPPHPPLAHGCAAVAWRTAPTCGGRSRPRAPTPVTPTAAAFTAHCGAGGPGSSGPLERHGSAAALVPWWPGARLFPAGKGSPTSLKRQRRGFASPPA